MIHTQLSMYGITYMGGNQCIFHACLQQMHGNDAHPQSPTPFSNRTTILTL